MNEVVLLIGAGVLGYMLYSQSQNTNNLQSKIDELSGKLSDAEDQIYENQNSIENSALNAGNNDVIYKNFRKSMTGTLSVDYPGKKSHDINGFFRLSFRNNSEYTYIIEAIKATLYIAGYEVDRYIPGNRKAVTLYQNGEYVLKSDWQERDWFEDSDMAFDAFDKLEQSTYSKPTSNSRHWTASQKMATADIAIKLKLKGSDAERVVTFSDVPLELYQYPDGKYFDYIDDGNALDWGSDAEF